MQNRNLSEGVELEFKKVFLALLSELQEFLYLVRALPNDSGRSPMHFFGIRVGKLRKIQQKFLEVSNIPPVVLRQTELFDLNSLEMSKACYEAKGLFPISFSWPGEWRFCKEKVQLISNVIPGKTYSYEDHNSYLRQYEESEYAFTFKKGGWDCFRHVEILASGCIPLMPDASAIPPFTMVHYPKRMLLAALESNGRSRVAFGQELVGDLRKSLSSESMAAYFLDASGYVSGQILFVDQSLPSEPDYLSVLSLIGLKQLLGNSVQVTHPVSYIYDDFQGDTSALYGRGFGYTKILSGNLKNSNEHEHTSYAWPEVFTREFLGQYSRVVFGNLTNSRALINKFEAMGQGSKGIYLRGDDRAPNRSEYRSYRRLVGRVFSREVY